MIKKTNTIAVMLFIFSLHAFADVKISSFTTRDGDAYTDVVVTKVNATSIDIMHSEGACRVPIEKLPDSIIKRLGLMSAEQVKLKKEEEENVKALAIEKKNRLEAEMKAKGLVKVDGKWLTHEEIEALKEEKAKKEQENIRKELAATAIKNAETWIRTKSKKAVRFNVIQTWNEATGATDVTNTEKGVLCVTEFKEPKRMSVLGVGQGTSEAVEAEYNRRVDEARSKIETFLLVGVDGVLAQNDTIQKDLYWCGTCVYTRGDDEKVSINKYAVSLQTAVSLVLAQDAAVPASSSALATSATTSNPSTDPSVVKQRDAKALAKSYRKDAEQGDAKAQKKLGDCYSDGDGVDKDVTEAVKWYSKAADQGNAAAQADLGLCYANGIGVAKDEGQAVVWWRKAADQGFAIAQYNLGLCYFYGNGVTKDMVQAAALFRMAAEQGRPNAQFFLGSCYTAGRGVVQDNKQAAAWYRKAAEQGDADGQLAIGDCYAEGLGVTQSWPQAVSWYSKAAEQGNADAQWALGMCYARGRGVAHNMQKAVDWYRKAAEQGNADALFCLGLHYEVGSGVAKNINLAVGLIRKAAEAGNEKAKKWLNDHGYRP